MLVTICGTICFFVLEAGLRKVWGRDPRMREFGKNVRQVVLIEDETTNLHCFSKKTVFELIYTILFACFSHIATCILFFGPNSRTLSTL